DVRIGRRSGTENIVPYAGIEAQPTRQIEIRLDEWRAKKLSSGDLCRDRVARSRRGEVVLVARAIPPRLAAEGDLSVRQLPARGTRRTETGTRIFLFGLTSGSFE